MAMATWTPVMQIWRCYGAGREEPGRDVVLDGPFTNVSAVNMECDHVLSHDGYESEGPTQVRYDDRHSTDGKYLREDGARYSQLMDMLQVSFILDDIVNVIWIVGLVSTTDQIMKTAG